MIKKFNDFLNESNASRKRIEIVDVDIDPQELIDKLRSGNIELDLRRPDDAQPLRKGFKQQLFDEMADKIEMYRKFYKEKGRGDYRITELPYSFESKEYRHPINNVFCYYLLTDMDHITLGTLENEKRDFWYEELDIPETIIKGDFYTFELDIPSGKMCFCGDWVRDIFVEQDWKETKGKVGGDYHYVEKDAVEHIQSFLSKGYFFVADSFYPAISKKDDTYYLYRQGEYDDESLGKTISRLEIDSDHTMVIIDGTLLNKKLRENKKEFDKLSSFDKKYLKYCLDVEPGKYEIQIGASSEDVRLKSDIEIK